jgi:hypothetical protein
VTRTAVITSRWRYRYGAALSRGNGHRTAVLAHRRGRYPAHRLAALRPCRSRPQGGPSCRRGPEPPASSRKGHVVWSFAFTVGHPTRRSRRARSASRPSMSWPACAVLLGTGSPLMDEPRYRRVGGAQYGDPVEGHAADQAPGWPARCGATAEGLPTPRYPTTSSMSLCSRPS